MKKIHIFLSLAGKYTSDENLVQKLWVEIQTLHSSLHRYYHTLAHLEQIYTALQPVWKMLQNEDAVLFALFYHDSIYNPQSGSNEEESAALARRRMLEIGVSVETIQKTRETILATKAHQYMSDSDTDLFTDADLSILGAPLENYAQYAKAVRAEYAIYNDAVYTAGRAKVLKHFLAMDRIFKTEYFFQKLEIPARENIKREIQLYI